MWEKILVFSTFIIIISSQRLFNAGQSVRCRFTMTFDSIHKGNIYTCEVSGSFKIVSRDVPIIAVIGSHQVNQTIFDVKAFKADAARIEFFPKDLDKLFSNLQSILINLSRLKEIRQVDLQPFPKLRHLDLFENKIEYLERNLFRFNEELEVIWLSNNKIKAIHVTAFEGLKNLKKLFLGGNVCIGESADTENGIQQLIDRTKQVCRIPPEYVPEDVTSSPSDDTQPIALNETQLLKRKLLFLEDEIFSLKEKREKILIKMGKVESENSDLKNSQNLTLKQIDQLNKTIELLNGKLKKGDTEGATYIREAFQLRAELNKQMNDMSVLVSGYKQQLNALNFTLVSVSREKNELKRESLERLKKSFEFRDKFENLQATKESRDLINLVVILLLMIVIMGLVAPGMIAKYSRKSRSSFNSFENAMKVKMSEQEGE